MDNGGDHTSLIWILLLQVLEISFAPLFVIVSDVFCKLCDFALMGTLRRKTNVPSSAGDHTPLTLELVRRWPLTCVGDEELDSSTALSLVLDEVSMGAGAIEADMIGMGYFGCLVKTKIGS